MDDGEHDVGYRLKDGGMVDDDTLEEMAQEWEDGSWEGHLENVAVGVSRLDDDPLTTVSFRLPASRLVAIEAAIERAGITKSEFYRRAVDHELASLA